ncbi:hypothetical protein R6Z07F_019169 [Ovis aries]
MTVSRAKTDVADGYEIWRSVRENPGASIPGLRVLKKQVLLESELRVNPPELDEAKGCRCRLRTGERWQGGGALRLELRFQLLCK